MKWDKPASGTTISADGSTWTQGGGHDWQGVIANQPLCTYSSALYEWTVSVEKGKHHQVGIALRDWNGLGTDKSGSSEQFAFLYSYTSGWDRHRGAATPEGAPDSSTWWSGTWSRHKKGREITVRLDCTSHTFEIKTEQQHLGKMKYPDSWKVVYAAAAGQSSDHVYKIGTLLWSGLDKVSSMLSCYLFCRSTEGCSGVTWGGEVCRLHMRGMSLWERKPANGFTSIHLNCGWNGGDHNKWHKWDGSKHAGTPNDMAYRATRPDKRCGPDFRTDSWKGSPDQAAHCEFHKEKNKTGPCCSTLSHCGDTAAFCSNGSINFSKLQCFRWFSFFFSSEHASKNVKPEWWIEHQAQLALSPSHCDAWSVAGAPKPNYWLTGHQALPTGMYIDLGCVAQVVGFRVTNTHNYVWNDYSTKDFRVLLRHWDYPYPDGKHENVNQWWHPLNVWTEVLAATLADSRGKVSSI